MRKEYYIDFKSFMSDLTNKEKNIKKDIESFKTALGNNINTIEIQFHIEKDLKNFKKLADELDESYNMKNAPVNIPESVLDKRQKEIAAFLASYNSMNEEFTKLVNDKYSFKGMIDENYNDKDEYRNKDTKELIKMTKDKMKEQDAIIEEILNKANNLNGGIKKDKDKTNETNKNIDKADSKLKKWAEKFKNFFKKK